MIARAILGAMIVSVTLVASIHFAPTEAKAAGRGQPTDWNRFFYYPYVFYPHNFQRQNTSYDNLYYRYPPSRRIPVYNKGWYNAYPTPRPYHRGHHFILDVF